MPRPFKCRFVDQEPGVTYFKPRGIPMIELEEVVLGVDELEAIRLADMEGLYQEDAAVKMEVSRQTFGNILHAAHAKVAQAIVQGKALKIQGGVFKTKALRGRGFAKGAGRGRGRCSGQAKGGPGLRPD